LVILRPKAEESLANARNVRVSEKGFERFLEQVQRSFVANAPQDDKKGDRHVATLLAMTKRRDCHALRARDDRKRVSF
jgi:hypothetical protein